MRKKLIKSKENETLDTLARMVQGGFDGMEKRFQGIDDRFDDVDAKIEDVHKRVDMLSEEMNFRFDRVEKILISELRERISLLEHAVFGAKK